ncbi:DNA polymerase III subunit gamma/tau [Spirochaeta isovalerica]|uniref:DNA polymerase III subunit gamma/tau n=1 Tax=Spirochaeta isovalerica TaxID=150 RepID=A0A841REA8_9SPIO|nr:DNA polymerase III subunit gamma/tau [Spirochaeta isovalerica]MBB6482323.1 DNA polymerase-3 subunit gamma/tau [Spirochaeta isovalerica]
MAYEVTASRKRPQKLDELSGQEFVAATLRRSIETERIAHAYLFSGPRGVGKTSSARILAKSLNCLNGPTADPCGTCTNCKEIAQGNSLDVIEIDGASNTGVNDIREIKDEVLFAPSNSKFKIYIIDEVHMLSNSAFNALLKTIEEPPPYIVFIFATTEIHKVPATIKSRCQQFNFRLISTDVIKELLASISDESGLKYEDDALFWIAKEATGSLRDAYTLYDQVVSFSEGELTLEKIREKLGLVGLDQMNELAELMADGKAADVIEYGETILNTGVAIEQFVIDLSEYFRHILFIKHNIRKESLLGFNIERFSRKVIDSFSVQQLEYAVDLTFQLYRDIRYSLNQRFELDILLSKMSSLAVYISPEAIMNNIGMLRNELVTGSISPGSGTSVTPTAPVKQSVIEETGFEKPQDSGQAASEFFSKFRKNESPSVPVQERIVAQPEEEPAGEPELSSVELKNRLLKHLKSANMSLYAALSKAQRWELNDKILTLTFRSLFESSFVNRESSFIIDEMKKLFDKDIRIETVSNVEEQEKKEESDPQIDLVKSVFRGQLIRGE